MSETLRIAPADATKNRQDALRTTIRTWGDDQGYLISDYRIVHGVFSASIMIERPREGYGR